MKIASWAIGMWKMLSTGNPINSSVVVICEENPVWICRTRQLRLLRAVLI
jgi:hypothetical protein